MYPHSRETNIWNVKNNFPQGSSVFFRLSCIASHCAQQYGTENKNTTWIMHDSEI